MNSRRKFTQTVATSAIAGAAFPGTRVLATTRHSPNEQINMGVIGIGPRCTYDLKSMMKETDVRFIAIADVQQNRRYAGKRLVDEHYGNRDCQLHMDFREMLAREDIDAVLIATGDRWHAAASIAAAEAGKDVYSEKPCGITIADCQRLSETMRQEERVFQAGTQRRSVPNFKQAVDLVHSGLLGELRELHASVYEPTLDNTWLPPEKTPDKADCDWNLWLGPAAWRPFNQKYVDGRWRGQWDFDSGARLLDWGAHTVDLCQWAANADDTMPVEYEPVPGGIHCTYESGLKIIIDFLKDPFGDRSPKYITRLGTCPVRFVGEEGWVETGDSGEIVVSEKLKSAAPESTKRVRGLDVSAHGRNFFDCIRSRDETAANATVMRRSHIACHAAAISWILGRKIRIDPVAELFVDDVEANLLLDRPQRDWSAT